MERQMVEMKLTLENIERRKNIFLYHKARKLITDIQFSSKNAQLPEPNLTIFMESSGSSTLEDHVSILYQYLQKIRTSPSEYARLLNEGKLFGCDCFYLE